MQHRRIRLVTGGVVTLLLLVAAASLVVTPASAGGNVSITRTFTPSSQSDTSIIDSETAASSPNANRGNNNTMATRHADAGELRAYLQFDLSALPTGSSSVSGSATLWAVTVGSAAKVRSIGAYRLTGSWTETGITWNSRDGANDWTTQGGDFAGSPTATTSVSSSGTTYDWNIGADLALFLASSPTSNYGWVFKDDSDPDNNTLKDFGTKNNATAERRPRLTVTFTAPWDSYSDSGRTIVSDSFSSGGATVYMKGTGYASGNYSVGYYDGDNVLVLTDANISVTSGTLNSQVTPIDVVGAVQWPARGMPWCSPPAPRRSTPVTPPRLPHPTPTCCWAMTLLRSLPGASPSSPRFLPRQQ